MAMNILLESEQRRLLSRFVEADRKLPRAERVDFLILRMNGPTLVRHRGLNESLQIVESDLDILQQERLIAPSQYDNKGRPSSFYITPLGQKYVEQMEKPMEYS